MFGCTKMTQLSYSLTDFDNASSSSVSLIYSWDSLGTRNDPIDPETQAEKRKKWRNLIAFWILGLCNNYGYVVMLSAAHDIIESKFGSTSSSSETTNSTTTSRDCNTLSTGAILLADIIPSLMTKIVAPFLPFFVHLRLLSCVILAASGFVMVALAASEWLAILGVIVTSLSSGLGEVTLLGYSHFFDKNVISTWSSGTGGAGVIGAVSYAGLTLWLSTENTILVMLIVPVIEAIAFWIILVHPNETALPVSSLGNGSKENKKEVIAIPEKTLKEKLAIVPGLLKYMIPIGLVYLFEYFINQGLFELIDFEGIWLDHAAQYRWLQVDYQIGVFISRSSVNLVTINRIWIMAALQFVNVIIMTFETLYFYIPNIWIVFAIVLWEGLLGGGAYVNTFYKMSKEVPAEDREFSLGITTMADSIGIALAGWIAMPVHNAICKLPQPTRLG
ncbi:battenin isoform X1 [Neodiprion lecontei]|uniref:Battenin n=2 Tax=Neodiprion lecontei TaxID=441921 RepID=A0ABM3G999_NEOLC|nr:battenin isoform X1 [Neodiprion lecontei]